MSEPDAQKLSWWRRARARWNASMANAQRMDQALDAPRAEGHANGAASKLRHGLGQSGSGF